MSVFANDLFKLLSKLSLIKNQEELIDSFIETINSYNLGFSVSHLIDSDSLPAESFEIRTTKKILGYFGIINKFDSAFREYHEVFRSAVSVICIILDNLELNNAIEIDKKYINDTKYPLQNEEDKYRYLFEMVSDVLFLIDNQTGAILEVNKAAEQLYGYSREEFLQMHNTDISYQPGETRRASLIELDKIPLVYHRKKSGEIFPIEIFAKHYDWQGRRVHIAAVRDITERRKAEEERRESEIRFSTIFDSSPIGIVISNIADEKIIDANPAFINLTGYDREDIIGRTSYDLNMWYKPIERNIIIRMIRDQGSIRDFEVKYRNKSGEARDALISIELIELDNVQFVLTLVNDITERKKAEKAMLSAQIRFATVFRSSPIGIVITDFDDGKIIDANPAFMDIHGFSRDEIIGSTSIELKIWENPEQREIIRKIIFEQGCIKEYEIKIHKKTGEKRDVAISAEIIELEGEKVLLSLIQDVTEKRNAEEALLESEERFRALFENVTSGVALHKMVYDEQGVAKNYYIIDVNLAFEIHTGLSRDDVLGKLATELYGTTYPPYIDEYSGVVLTHKPYVFETFFEPLEKYFLISAISIKAGHFATVFEDITERKHKEEENKLKNEELTRFIYAVSHDLKSPLVTIKGFAGLLEKDIQNHDNEAVAKDIGYIKNSANRMGELLDELIELSRIGSTSNKKSYINLKIIVQSAIDLVAGRIAEHNVNIEMDIDDVIVYGDNKRLVEVYQNLIDNAVKFIDCEKDNQLIKIGYLPNESEIILYVRDFGIGIEKQYHGKIFQLFEKIKNDAEGTGIGLALVKRIIEVHGGKIWIESEGKGKGTTFYFTLEKTKLKTH